ncbi:MAG TPA: hypothetical protein VG293_08275 [Solirubrobacteraceae bacterium]|nr:hypothetical protein [Solirubrobacteraceae bacterium]
MDAGEASGELGLPKIPTLVSRSSRSWACASPLWTRVPFGRMIRRSYELSRARTAKGVLWLGVYMVSLNAAERWVDAGTS